MARVERYSRGAEAGNLVPGDFILSHRHHLFAALISQAERRRFRGPDSPYAHWSHTALVVDADGSLVEAEPFGVERSPLSKYRDDEYHLVRLGDEFGRDARQRSVAYAQGQVGKAFGYLELAGAGLYLIVGLPLKLIRGDHQTCASLVVHALQQGGMLEELDPDLSLPADLAKRFDVMP